MSSACSEKRRKLNHKRTRESIIVSTHKRGAVIPHLFFKVFLPLSLRAWHTVPRLANNKHLLATGRYLLLDRMEQKKNNMFMMTNSKFLPQETIMEIRQKLESVDDNKSALLTSVQFKDPTIVLVIGVLAGCLGVDRFYIGDIGLGIAKLLTGGGCGIWALIDLFLTSDATKRKNYEQLMQLLSM